MPQFVGYGILGNLCNDMKERIHRKFPSFDPVKATETSYGFNILAYGVPSAVAMSLVVITDGYSAAAAAGFGALGFAMGALFALGIENRIRHEILDMEPFVITTWDYKPSPTGKHCGSLVGGAASLPVEYVLSRYERAKSKETKV
ncbi:MAG: hypothetical protein AABX60_01125 [Nanoarchaeota archaeon]